MRHFFHLAPNNASKDTLSHSVSYSQFVHAHNIDAIMTLINGKFKND